MAMSRKGLNTLYGEGTLIQSGSSKKILYNIFEEVPGTFRE